MPSKVVDVDQSTHIPRGRGPRVARRGASRRRARRVSKRVQGFRHSSHRRRVRPCSDDCERQPEHRQTSAVDRSLRQRGRRRTRDRVWADAGPRDRRPRRRTRPARCVGLRGRYRDRRVADEVDRGRSRAPRRPRRGRRPIERAQRGHQSLRSGSGPRLQSRRWRGGTHARRRTRMVPGSVRGGLRQSDCGGYPRRQRHPPPRACR